MLQQMEHNAIVTTELQIVKKVKLISRSGSSMLELQI